MRSARALLGEVVVRAVELLELVPAQLHLAVLWAHHLALGLAVLYHGLGGRRGREVIKDVDIGNEHA